VGQITAGWKGILQALLWGQKRLARSVEKPFPWLKGKSAHRTSQGDHNPRGFMWAV